MAQTLRAASVARALAVNYLTFGMLSLRHGGRVPLRQRALWMHRSCRRVARAFQLEIAWEGTPPAAGLITSNHLSYLDVLAFASVMPCVFVSKADVLHWPVFGMLARFGGTLFVNRERRTAVESVSQQMEAVLAEGFPLVLFPEGTSTDGSEVLPYFPSLLEAAIRVCAPITPAAVAYASPGRTESGFCYFGDVSFLPHLRSLLRVPRAEARVRFGLTMQSFRDRKQAARELREHTLALRGALPDLPPVEGPVSTA
ncbi:MULTISPECIES: lysophospholipid acyltransferase family protein [Acidobacterium]|uniref:Putative 1-acyl-sn-glycerol-3-phosphate acyltransferase family protein n=1 Tax=Acidobacterium capsulatum (strain ATCC 51196 / DSM 11244 / BCRC 80197 / JCM 7670 / NBRC 15755 / NCIMB 13165 / 161) TaxID=240015 RepID=C1F6F8_ACIC5|nr:MULTISPECIES: lysophospholipid acyltransferase family protein [Acidobacterium]ACO31669.1 putative 1-acyl-sn-glycerol-3-phosphate acyltransferase family protein [Acidobacterium capsulatum ATCC 51196]